MKKHTVYFVAIIFIICATLLGRFFLQKYRHQQFLDYEENITEERDIKENQQLELVKQIGVNDEDKKLQNERKIGGEYSSYSTDGKYVYYIGYGGSFDNPSKQKMIIKTADPETFEVLQRGWTKDKNHVYFDGIIIDELDAASFTLLGDSKFLKDKNSIYLENIQYDISRWILKVETSDPKTFIALGELYGKDKNNAYFRAWIIEQADVNSFETINTFYAKDKNHVYNWGKIVNNADPKTFKP